MTYTIMLNPRHKRVYLSHANTMAINELTFLKQQLSQPVTDILQEDIGGLPHIVFEATEALNANDIKLLSRLSFAYALFEYAKPADKPQLTPITINSDYFIDEDISAILKYTGKTNELFTRLMLNLALSYRQNTTGPTRLLDPMAGKGTTLYEGLMQNLDVYGVEIDPKPVYEAFIYIKKHLEMARYKHSSHTEKTGGTATDGNKFSATRYQVEASRSKEEQKAGQIRQFEMIAGDTRYTGSYYKKDFFHLLVADLPYGVQHGAKKKPQGGNLTRNALELVSESMPGWLRVLKTGGTMVLAWNLFLIDRNQMTKLFTDNGLAIPADINELDFSHRLDQATHRDLIIGIKK